MPSREELIERLPFCLTETDLPVGRKTVGYTHDRYDLGDNLIIVSTDRHHLGDRGVTGVPYKGYVLNQMSNWWFRQTSHIIANYVIDVPDPNVIIAKNCVVYPVEVAVYSHITGSTPDSPWVRYVSGERTIGDHVLPDNMKKNQRLDTPLIIPILQSPPYRVSSTTTSDEVISLGIMNEEEWNYVNGKALELFDFGQKVSRGHGFILARTTYVFGIAEDGTIMLVDELHTPRSSHYWSQKTYHERFNAEEEPEQFDLGFSSNGDELHTNHLLDTFLTEFSARYIQLCEMITGERFTLPSDEQSIDDRIRMNLSPRFLSTSLYHLTDPSSEEPVDTEHSFNQDIREEDGGPRCIIIADSVSGSVHVREITMALGAEGIHWESHTVSVHQQAAELLDLLETHAHRSVIYITVSSQSNALSGFVAGNTDAVTIACPFYTDHFDRLTNIHSTIQMPRDVPVMTILEPRNVALAVRRIIDLTS